MKKSILAAAVMLSLGTSAAQAVSIDITTMEFYDANGAPGFFGGGLNTSVNTSVAFSAAGNGAADSGPTPFFGTAWTATQGAWFETTGVASQWAGTSASGAYDYNFTLNAGEVAVGLLFTWGSATDIAVLQIFDCSTGACVGVHNSSADDLTAATDATHTPGVDAHPTVPGSVMGNGPFAGQHATFKGQVVPVPAAVWLFGSGLLGLVGVARRKKAA